MTQENIPVNFIKEPLRVMNTQDVEEYMQHLNDTGGSDLTGIERQIESSLRMVAMRRGSLVNRANELRAAFAQIEEEDKRLLGEMNAFGYLLQKAEDDRRYQKQEESERGDDARKRETACIQETRKEVAPE